MEGMRPIRNNKIAVALLILYFLGMAWLSKDGLSGPQGNGNVTPPSQSR